MSEPSEIKQITSHTNGPQLENCSLFLFRKFTTNSGSLSNLEKLSFSTKGSLNFTGFLSFEKGLRSFTILETFLIFISLSPRGCFERVD